MYTEDDTFKALLRIPQSQVREKLDEFGLWYKEYREDRYAAVAYNKRIKKWNILKRFVGLSTYRYRDPVNPLFEEDMEEKLKGTGWTLESYAVEIDKPILERRGVIHNIKMKRRTYFLWACLLMLALGILLATSSGLVWIQGLLLGVQLCNIVTVTYLFVADKFFPYLSYHYRYE